MIGIFYSRRILIFVSINLLRLESLKEMLEWWMLLEIRVLNINIWTMNIISNTRSFIIQILGLGLLLFIQGKVNLQRNSRYQI